MAKKSTTTKKTTTKKAPAKKTVGKKRPPTKKSPVTKKASKVQNDLGDITEANFDPPLTIRTEVYQAPDNPMTADRAKEILGWEEVTDSKASEFRDKNGVPVRCNKNAKNRPLSKGVVDLLVQEILRRNFRLNCENIIVGEHDTVLNGQHRLISTVFAAQIWEKDKEAYSWEEEPYIETLVAYGAKEDDETVNTMDTCRPRSLSDVIYRSGMFPDFSGADLKRVSRIVDYAVRSLWHRTGAKNDPYAPRRTHSEALDFLDNHPKVLEACRFIFDEEAGSERRVSSIISPGYAASFLYMMGVSASDNVEEYLKNRTEEILDLEMWEKAEEFWVKVASHDPTLQVVSEVIGDLKNEEKDSVPYRLSVLVAAWENWSAGNQLTKSILRPEEVEEDGVESLLDPWPSVGGIDLGDPEQYIDEDRAAGIEKRKKAEKENGQSLSFKVGQTVYVDDPEGYYEAVIVAMEENADGSDPIFTVQHSEGESDVGAEVVYRSEGEILQGSEK